MNVPKTRADDDVFTLTIKFSCAAEPKASEFIYKS